MSEPAAGCRPRTRPPSGALIASLASSPPSATDPQTTPDPPATGQSDDHYTADTIDPGALVTELAAARDTLTLEQVLASLLKHQSHQLDALRSATHVTAERRRLPVKDGRGNRPDA